MAYATAIIFFFGKLFYPYPIFDICLLLFALFNLKNFKKNNNKFFWIFLIYTLITARFKDINSFFYFLRLSALLSFFIIPPIFSKKYNKFFLTIVFANLVFGLIQYFIWPNFTYFSALNWDPHLYRLVSTFFDPTFTGLIYLMFFTTIFFQNYPSIFLIFTYIPLALTYSRSSFLAFIVGATFLSKQKNNVKIFAYALLITLCTVILLPRLEGEGTKLERSSSIKAKIENYKEGIALFKKHPIFGVGYNNLKIARKLENNPSHSASGFDGSLLTILTTTGLIGFFLFIGGLYQLFIRSDLLHKTLLIIILVHSLFSNSLLYPYTLFFFFSI